MEKTIKPTITILWAVILALVLFLSPIVRELVWISAAGPYR